jgi:hypothetical protein
MPPLMAVTFADGRDVGRGARERDDRNGLALLEAAGRRVERDHGGGDAGDEPGSKVADAAAGAHRGRDRLDGDVGHTEEDAGRGAEHHAVMLVRVELLREHEERAEREQRGLEDDHPGGRVARVAAVVRQRDR